MFNVHFSVFCSTYIRQSVDESINKSTFSSPVVFICSIHPKCKERIVVWLFISLVCLLHKILKQGQHMCFLFLFTFLLNHYSHSFSFLYNCGPNKSFQLSRFLSITHCTPSRLWSLHCLLSRLSELFEDTNRKQHHSQHHNLNCWLPPQSTGRMILHFYQFCC